MIYLGHCSTSKFYSQTFHWEFVKKRSMITRQEFNFYEPCELEVFEMVHRYTSVTDVHIVRNNPTEQRGKRKEKRRKAWRETGDWLRKETETLCPWVWTATITVKDRLVLIIWSGRNFTYIERSVPYSRIAPLGVFFLSTCWTLSYTNLPHIYEVLGDQMKVVLYASLIQDLVVLPLAYTWLVRANHLHFLEMLCKPAIITLTTSSRWRLSWKEFNI